MSSPNLIGVVFLSLLGFTSFFLKQISHRFSDPYPLITSSLNTPENQLQDAGSIILGLRRLGADIAWIQTLQYYGTQESGQSEFDFENGIGKYPQFLNLCRRVSGLDPYFTYVYYYGGSVLGWNLNRPSEAEELLKAGIASNPKEYRLAQFLAALAYQKNHDPKNLMLYLQSISLDPDCPLILKTILANLYKKQHEYIKALDLWRQIYQIGTPDNQNRALEQIQALQQLISSPKP